MKVFEMRRKRNEITERLLELFDSRSDGKKAFEDLQEISQILPERKFNKLIDELVNVSWPYVLTQHGFNRSLKSFKEADIWEGLEMIRASLEQYGAKVFLSSGSLLGLYREGSLLLMDDDIDLGVYWPGEDALQVAKRMAEMPHHLHELKFSEYLIANESHHAIRLPNLPNFDIFPTWQHDTNNLCAYPHGLIQIGDVFPTSQIKRGEHRVPVPSHPEKLLELAYGEWSVPNKAFTYDWEPRLPHLRSYMSELSRLRDGL